MFRQISCRRGAGRPASWLTPHGVSLVAGNGGVGTKVISSTVLHSGSLAFRLVGIGIAAALNAPAVSSRSPLPEHDRRCWRNVMFPGADRWLWNSMFRSPLSWVYFRHGAG